MVHSMDRRLGLFLCVFFNSFATDSAQCVIRNTNITLEHGQSHSDCKQRCTCDYGRLSCVSACPPSIRASSKECPNPQKEKPSYGCCEVDICAPCPVGRWGLGCSKECGKCAGEKSECNITTGECRNNSPRCLSGYFGNSCTQSCVPGKYGSNCAFTCGRCAGRKCNITSGVCFQKKPRCLPGWRGLQCQQQCREGWYGPDCQGQCGACAAGNCNRTTGECFLDVPLCKPGYSGDLCQKACEPGTFGPECQWSCGGCLSGLATCKPQNGECPDSSPRCMPGYMGNKCKACPRGRWGVDCKDNCSVNCVRGELECERRDGTCIGGCLQGYVGDLCQSLESNSPDLATVIGLSVGFGVLILVVVCVGILLYLYIHRHSPSSKLRRDASYLTPCQEVPMSNVNANQTYEVPITLSDTSHDHYLQPCPTVPQQVPMSNVDANQTYEVPITLSDTPHDHYLQPCPTVPQIRPEVYSFYETLLPPSDWDLNIDNLDIKTKTMVQGSFGETQLALWKFSLDNQVHIAVGLRKFMGNGSDEKKNLINRQLERLRSLDRCMNVLAVLGSSLDPHTGNLYLILEWTEEGNLSDYLQHQKAIGQPQTRPSDDVLLKFCLDVSLAMVHLLLNQISGVDLSTKTIMLDKNLDAKLTGFVKFDVFPETISDKHVDESWRWLSLEALTNNNNCTASDVWSFGVFLWAVFSLGDTPYSEFMSGKELRGQLEAGCRLGHPSRAPTAAYVLMTECWQTDPLLRPNFADIVDRLQAIPSTNHFYTNRKSDLYSEPQ